MRGDDSVDAACFIQETRRLAVRIYDAPHIPKLGFLVSRAQVMSVQRALRKLAKEKAIVDFGIHNRRKHWILKEWYDELAQGVESFNCWKAAGAKIEEE